VILRDKSPRAMAVDTSAMLRTWPVQVSGHRVDVVSQVLHVPATPGTIGLSTQLAFRADLARDAGHSAAKLFS